MYKRTLQIIIILLILITGCTRTTQVKHKTVTTINDTIIEEYYLSSPIKTYITRPNLEWEIKVTDTSDCDDIFIKLLSMIKSENIYEILREDYNDYFIRILFKIYNDKNELIKEYSSSYYKVGTIIYDDDSKNEIDNFRTWTIEDHQQNSIDIFTYMN